MTRKTIILRLTIMVDIYMMYGICLNAQVSTDIICTSQQFSVLLNSQKKLYVLPTYFSVFLYLEYLHHIRIRVDWM